MNRVVGLADAFWVTWPRRLMLRFPSVRGIAGDGHVLTTVPVAAVVLPLLVLLGFFGTGALRLGYEDVYTESVLLVMTFVALGAFSSQLGVLAVAAFVLGDVVSTRPVLGYEVASSAFWFSGPLGQGVVAHLVHVRLPDLMTYLLLATVVVVLPRAARGVVGGVGQGRRMPPVLAWSLVSGLVVGITWLGVDAWVAAAPTLVRPIFTWGSPSGAPTVEAVATMQEQGSWVVAAAVTAALVRQLWLGAVMLPGPLRDRLAAAESAPSPERSRGRAPVRSRPWTAAVLSATFATLALAGILEQVLLWPLTFAVFFAVRLLRSDQLRVGWLDRWRRIAAVLPAWARLLAVWLLSRVAAQSVDNTLIGSYSALTFVVLLSVVVVFAVFPGQPPQDEDPDRATVAPGTGGTS